MKYMLLKFVVYNYNDYIIVSHSSLTYLFYMDINYIVIIIIIVIIVLHPKPL